MRVTLLGVAVLAATLSVYRPAAAVLYAFFPEVPVLGRLAARMIRL